MSDQDPVCDCKVNYSRTAAEVMTGRVRVSASSSLAIAGLNSCGSKCHACASHAGVVDIDSPSRRWALIETICCRSISRPTHRSQPCDIYAQARNTFALWTYMHKFVFLTVAIMASLRLTLRLLVTTVLAMIMLVPASDASSFDFLGNQASDDSR